MKAIKDKMVSIHYTLKDDAGNLIDSSLETEPLEYLHGNGLLLKKLEDEIEGKEPGAKFTLKIDAKDGYGEYDEKLVTVVPRNQFDSSLEIEPGMQFADTTGTQIVTVKEVNAETVTIDGNHELAGKNLIFDISIEAVRDATEAELRGTGGCGGCDCQDDDECLSGGCSGNCGRCH